MIPTVQGAVPANRLFGLGLYDSTSKSPDVAGWLREEAYADSHDHHNHHHDVNRHGDGIRAFCIYYDSPLHWDSFVDWIEGLIATHGNDLLRIKGILDVVEAEGPVAIHGVQHVFHPPAMLETWPDDDRRSRIVMITRRINKEPVEQMFRKFMEFQG